jgi:hypothetical protein
MIGTNADSSLAVAQAALTECIAAYRAAGATVICNLVFQQSGDTPGPGDYRTELNTWLSAPGRVDHYMDARDPAGANVGVADLSDGTHLNLLGDKKLGTAAAAFLSELAVTSDVYTSNPVSFADGTLAGTAGTAGAGASGSFATGWTAARTLGDGSVVGSKVTLGGKTAQRLAFTGAAANTTIEFRRTFTVDQFTGEGWDMFATVEFVSGGPPIYVALSSDPGTASADDVYHFPSNSGTPLTTSEWGGAPFIWRGYAKQNLSGDTTSVEIRMLCQVAPGVTATFDIADIRLVLRDPLAFTIPANTVLPVVSGAAADSTPSGTTGTWTGYRPPTYAYQWLLDGVAIDGQTALVYSGTLLVGDIGKTLALRVTATNGAGTVSATNTGVTIEATSLLPTWNNTVNFSGQLTYSNSDRTVSNNGTTNGVRYARQLLSPGKTSGKWYAKATLSNGAVSRGFGIGTNTVGGSVGGTNGSTRWYWTGTSAFTNTGTSAMGSSISTTDGNYEIAFDLDLDLIWFKVEGGNWNNNASANPDDGALGGGFSISGTAGQEVFLIVGHPNNTTASSTLIAGTPPSLFTAL